MNRQRKRRRSDGMRKKRKRVHKYAFRNDYKGYEIEDGKCIPILNEPDPETFFKEFVAKRR